MGLGIEIKEYLWGYGSGVVAATTPDYGDVVIAEYTQPFNQNDISYFRPLYAQAVTALTAYSTNVTADAAFDAWYVYDRAARHGGIGAVPRECSLLHSPRSRRGATLRHWLTHASHLSVQSHLWLSCTTLSLSVALPGKD